MRPMASPRSGQPTFARRRARVVNGMRRPLPGPSPRPADIRRIQTGRVAIVPAPRPADGG
jgi:hypothetical protein